MKKCTFIKIYTLAKIKGFNILRVFDKYMSIGSRLTTKPSGKVCGVVNKDYIDHRSYLALLPYRGSFEAIASDLSKLVIYPEDFYFICALLRNSENSHISSQQNHFTSYTKSMMALFLNLNESEILKIVLCKYDIWYCIRCIINHKGLKGPGFQSCYKRNDCLQPR